MPRPTRSRVAATRRGGESLSTPSDPAITSPAATATPDESGAPIRSDETDIYGVSDREIERQRKAKETSAATRGTRTRSANAALSASRAQRDTAMARLDDLTSTTANADDSPVVEIGRKDSTMEVSSLLGGGGIGRRGGAGAGADLSGMEIADSEIFGNLDSSFDATLRGEGSDSRSGVRNADTSTFNVSVFRRQPSRTRRRQSSIVGKDDAPIRPSSRGPTTPGLSSTFSLGNFKRRQRQPSILLSSAQKASLSLQRSRATSAASGDEGQDENAVESDVEESFLPEAEGTPVRVSRGRKSEEADVVAGPETPDQGGRETRSKKRKSTEAHGGESAKRQAVEKEMEEQEEDDETMHQSVDSDALSSPPSSPPQPRRRASPEQDDDIFAPPASISSREGSPTIWPSLKNLGKKHHGHPPSRTKTPALDDGMSDISEPPSLTHSPNFKGAKTAAAAAANKRSESPKLSTADLEALLPRRRRKAQKDTSDVEDGESSAPEIVELPRRVTKKKTSKALNGSAKTNRANNQAKTIASAPALGKRTGRRKYGSRNFDKENITEGDSIEVARESSPPLDDTAFEAEMNGGDETEMSMTPGLGAELKAASEKFKEVDEWELDFEEVVEPSSDLPEGR